jgi:hypothetical protein
MDWRCSLKHVVGQLTSSTSGPMATVGVVQHGS